MMVLLIYGREVRKLIINWLIKLKMRLDNKVLVRLIQDKYKSGEIPGLIDGGKLFLNLTYSNPNGLSVSNGLVSVEKIILEILTEDIDKIKEKYPFPKPLDENRISSIIENKFANNNGLYDFISDLKKQHMPEAQQYTEYIIHTLIEVFKNIFIGVIIAKLTGII